MAFTIVRQLLVLSLGEATTPFASYYHPIMTLLCPSVQEGMSNAPADGQVPTGTLKLGSCGVPEAFSGIPHALLNMTTAVGHQREAI